MNFQIPKHIEQLGRDIQEHELKYHNKRVAVTKSFTFDSAHHLHAYEGKCKSLHGHTYRLVVTISGFVDENGFAVDFADIKQLYKKTIESRLDHRYLNEVLPNMNTTAENMIVWIWEQLAEGLRDAFGHDRGLRLEELILYETPTSYATLRREWMDHAD
ncbi:MAG TPA: 6-carboxytetrahydropterin synthase QueD [Bacillales bacterium]|nr:6-carboxytetrahydropterin synthase QueD [Bacillales bacterium]